MLETKAVFDEHGYCVAGAESHVPRTGTVVRREQEGDQCNAALGFVLTAKASNCSWPLHEIPFASGDAPHVGESSVISPSCLRRWRTENMEL
jgi:hypothetical protein